MSGRVSSEDRFEELARELESQPDALLERTWDRLCDHLPDWVVADPVANQRVREFSRQSIVTQLRSFRSQRLPESCPDADRQAAREIARLKMPLEPLLAGHRLGHRGAWEAWLELVERRSDDAEERRCLLERGSVFLFDYAERLTTLATEEYERERAETQRNPEQRRLHLIRDLLEGEPVDSGALGWDLDHHHLGILAWAEGADDASRELSALLGRPLLLVETSVEGTWWGWASSSAPLSPEADRAIAAYRPTRGRLAIGLENAGPAGFRLTHRQASRAGWVAWYTEDPLTRFADVALEGLAIQDSESARSFVANELAGFDDESTRAARLRETLHAYFEAGHNAATAAAAIGVHHQTVANRIRAVEELTGSSVTSRRGELELALRLHRCFERPPSVEMGLQHEGYLP